MNNSNAINESIIAFRHVKELRESINEWVSNNPIKNTMTYKERFDKLIRRTRVKGYKNGDISSSITPEQMKELSKIMFETLS